MSTRETTARDQQAHTSPQTRNWLFNLPALHDAQQTDSREAAGKTGDGGKGITSVCSAHSRVIGATFAEAMETGQPVLIEATSNQVNQFGGYTGMSPADFITFVNGLAHARGFDRRRILFGGDHLGPNPWRREVAESAMEKAKRMVRDYARAGFSKIHLDASMACADDADPLSPAIVAERAAQLAEQAEKGAREGGHAAPAYIIGTEVPVPGGATHALDTVAVTHVADASETLELHRLAFGKAGLEAAFARVVGLVVQPGVEFGHSDIVRFDAQEAAPLTRWRNQQGGVVFEAHSTDYQSARSLRELVLGGFAILKVGPGLTFAMREALYALDAIAAHLDPDYPPNNLPDAMEEVMLGEPGDWEPYYHGTDAHRKLLRHFSYSDRIRYYWAREWAVHNVTRLLETLQDRQIPETLVSQYLPWAYGDVAEKRMAATPSSLIDAAIRRALAPYSAACAD